MTAQRATVPRSLIWATDIDVLGLDRVVERRDGYLVVRSPGNATHYSGNLLLFDAPPSPGDGPRWEALFAAEFAGQPQSEHRTFGWDDPQGALGAAETEFAARGYDVERTVALIARAAEIRPHPRANRDVEIRALDPDDPVDEPLWAQVVEIQVASRDADRFGEEEHRSFSVARQSEHRALFRAGRGAWYVALLGGDVVGSCGVVVTDGRGRFQIVETAAAHRRKGICSRLVAEAAHDAAARHGARRLVIAADPGYHAMGIYESLGFRPAERAAGVCRPPDRD